MTQNDNYIIVNYHYVEDPHPKAAGIFPCSIADFEKQAAFLAGNYKVASIPEVYKAAQDGRAGKFCAITFDDGLKDQYQNALPVLEKHKVSATFFPITSAFEGRLPAAHKVHILLSKVSSNQAIDVFNDFMAEFYPDLKDQYSIAKDKRLTQRRLHEDVAPANFKEMMIMLPEDIKAQFLRFCFKKFHLDEARYAKNLFMNEAEIKDLQKKGMTVGNHSHSHYTFDLISEAVMKKELEISQGVLKDILGAAPKLFSYPHGRYGKAAEGVLAKAGFDLALIIERRGISKSDGRFLVPRYDTADLRDLLTK